MKTKYLLPHSLKLPGWIILGVGIIFGLYTLLLMNYLHYLVDIIYLLFNMNNSNYYDDFKNLHCDYFFDDLAGCLIIIGSLFITLSKEKIDDEYIMNVRYQSLFWALIVNSIMIILALFSIYGISFYYVSIFSMVSIPILFLVKFKIALKRNSNSTKKYLLPNSLKNPGWIILGLGILLAVLMFSLGKKFELPAYVPAIYYYRFGLYDYGWFKMFHDKTIIDELAGLLIIVGSLFITLSKEKSEDEYIMKIRLESLLWALISNSILLITAIFAFYDWDFYMVMNINIVSIPVLFVIKYKLALRRGY